MENTEATKARLAHYVERAERLEEQKAEIQEDMRMLFQEAKSDGFDTKIMKEVIKLRKKDVEDRLMEEELLEVYKKALGMVGTDE